MGVTYNYEGCSGEQFVDYTVGECSGYNNKGQYQSAVAQASNAAYKDGLLTNKERAVIVRTAAKNGCN